MTLISRNIIIDGRRTSIRLEDQMWIALHNIARREKCTVHDLCGLIQARRPAHCTLTAAIRVFIMLYYKLAETEEGHAKAGHGDFNLMKVRAKFHGPCDKHDQDNMFQACAVGS